MPRVKLGELLVQAGIIDELQLRSALAEQRKWGHPLGRTLIELKLIDETTLVAALSRQLNIPAIDPAAIDRIPREVLSLLGYEFCHDNGCIPFRHTSKGNFLDVAMTDPTNPELFDKIRVATRCNVRPNIVGPIALDAAIRRHYLGQAVDLAPAAPAFRADEPMLDLGGLTPLVSRELAIDPAVASPPPIGQDPMPLARAATASSDELRSLQGEVQRLAAEVQKLASLLDRDEKVIRKLLAFLVEKGLCNKQELMARIGGQ
jgi:type IV pilus assembly protein PilB